MYLISSFDLLNYPKKFSPCSQYVLQDENVIPNEDFKIKILCFLITGTMQTLDARHIELFLNEGYHDGSWDYDTLGSHDIKKQAEGASGGIFDVEHLKDQSTSGITTIFQTISSFPPYICIHK